MRHLRAARKLSADELVSGVEVLLANEREVLADVLAHLAVIDAARLFVELGHPSMFRFAVDGLGMSDGQAGHRITAARLLIHYPVIEELVAEGRLHLSGLKVLGPHLTIENHQELLEAAAKKSRRQIEELVAAWFPKPDVEPIITPRSPASSPAEPAPDPVAPASTPAARRAPPARPVSADSFSVTFTIDRACHEKLEYVQALLREAVPDGDPGAILDRGLDALIPMLERRKFGITDKPRRSAKAPKPSSRYVPAEVRRQVVARDGLRCRFVAANGTRCCATERLQFHHLVPHGRGGLTIAENVEIRCAIHNQYHADQDYGRAFMEARRRERGPTRPQNTAANNNATAGTCPPPPGSGDAHAGGAANDRGADSVVHSVERPRTQGEPIAVDEPAVTPETWSPTLTHDAYLALVQLGFKQGEARYAVDRATATSLPSDSLETLLRRALRFTPQTHVRVTERAPVRARGAPGSVSQTRCST